MKKIILILFITITTFSCHYQHDYIMKWQKQYVADILKNPENIQAIIFDGNSIEDYPTESRKKFISKDSLQAVINYIKKNKEFGYKVEYQIPWICKESETNKFHFYDEIYIIGNSNDFFLNFHFETENCKFNLVHIDTNRSSIYQGKRDLSHGDSVLKNNGNIIDLICKNPDELKNIIDNSEYYSARSRYKVLCNDSLVFYSDYIKKLAIDGFEIVDRYSNFFGDSYIVPRPAICIDDDVVIKGKNNELYLNFIFSSENDKEILSSIIVSNKTQNQRVGDYWNAIGKGTGEDLP
jgi:hypothetical protein